jgi:hypothetical protein
VSRAEGLVAAEPLAILEGTLEALAGGSAAEILSRRAALDASGSELERALRGILLRAAADPRRLEGRDRARGSRIGAAPSKAARDLSSAEDAESLRAALAARLPFYLSGLLAGERLSALDLGLAELVADASAAMGGERAAPLSRPVESRRDSSRSGLDRMARRYDTLGRLGGMPIPSELSKLSAAEFFPAPPRRARSDRDAIEGYARDPFADDLALYGIYEYLTGRMLKFAAEKSARLAGEIAVRFVIEEPLWDCRARSAARALPLLLARFAALGNRNIEVLRLEVLRGNGEDGFGRFRYDLPARSLAADPGFFFREETLPYFAREARPEAAPMIPPFEDYILLRIAGRPGLPRGPAGRPGPDELAADRRCLARVVLSEHRAELYYGPSEQPSFEGLVLVGAELGFTPDRGLSLTEGFEDLLVQLRALVSGAVRA